MSLSIYLAMEFVNEGKTSGPGIEWLLTLQRGIVSQVRKSVRLMFETR